jgi:hypothetical protein
MILRRFTEMFDTNWPYAYRSYECYDCTYNGFDYRLDAGGGFINNCFFCPLSHFPENNGRPDDGCLDDEDDSWSPGGGYL